jgi:myo-inositol-1(or 4)-monophosphatase
VETPLRGPALAATDTIVCLCADTDDPVIERMRSWAQAREFDFAAHPVGSTPPLSATGTLGVSVGGDGTFLEAVRLFGPAGIPVAGVNRGTLSFLARIQPADATDALGEICRGEATVHPRQQFRVTARSLDTVGINDVMIEPPGDRRECRLHVFADREYVGESVGGGLSLTTPTGSTAMGLSAGGPLQHPDGTATLQLVSLHHEQLGVRSVVLDADREIALVPATTVRVTVDGGRATTTLAPDRTLRVTGADRPALLVRTTGEASFIDALGSKLGWALADDEAVECRPRRGERAGEGAGNRDDDSEMLARACRVAREATRAAGDLVGRYREQIEAADDRARKRLCAEAERTARRVLVAAIEHAFPEHAIDDGTGPLAEGFTWVLDPVDGVTNFEYGNPNYCTTVALLEDCQPVVGVVHAPETGELFWAVADGVAHRNDVQIEPTDRRALDESLLLSGYDPDGQFLQTFYRHTRGVRRLGSQALALAFLAAGSADALWAYDTSPEDVAAGLCILRAAGGRATDAAGAPYRLERTGRAPLLASNGPLHPAVQSLLQK